MGRTLISSTHLPLKFSISLPPSSPNRKLLPLTNALRLRRMLPSSTTRFSAKAVISEYPYAKKFAKIGAQSTGPVPAKQLLEAAEKAAKTGAEVVMEAVNKPRNINYKGITDLVTDTDKASETAILEVVRKTFKDHLILGEEGGIIGDTSSNYLWCIDPLGLMLYTSFEVTVVEYI